MKRAPSHNLRGLSPVSGTELTDQKCTDFKTSRNNFKLSIFFYFSSG